MVIREYECDSCAMASINNLGIHKDAVHALKSFCMAGLGAKTNKFVTGAGSKQFSKLTSFYLFCAGPEVPQNSPGGSHHSKEWVRYGTEFAEYIVEHGLGEVVTVGPKLNAKNHPRSTAQTWLWSPNQKALEQWWVDNS